MADGFKDYIPEGEDQGAFAGGNGYQDFVPDQVATEIPSVDEINVVETPKESFKCDQCDFTTTVKLALAGHKRSHK
jgi:hypothetical protein